MIRLEDFWQDLLQSELQQDGYWRKKLLDTDCKIHLALMVEPYLSFILNGKKTMESRFSTKRIIPFHRIAKGDIVVLKRTGGGITAVFEAGEVRFLQIDSAKILEEIKRDYGNELCLDDAFWEKKKDAKYVSLIQITHLQTVTPIAIKKANRQSWLTYAR